MSWGLNLTYILCMHFKIFIHFFCAQTLVCDWLSVKDKLKKWMNILRYMQHKMYVFKFRPLGILGTMMHL